MSFTYKGLKAEYKRHIVTDAEMDQYLERLRQQTPKIKVITDRAAQMGDELVLDYAGFCDGEQFQGGTAQMQTLVLGSGSFIPGFELQLFGCRPGEEVTVEVTFPEQYHAAELAGKPAQFKCLIHEIREKGEYELGDEFAQSMGIATFDELKTQLYAQMQAFSDQRGEKDLEDQLIRQVAESYAFLPSEEMIEESVNAQMEMLKEQLAQKGLTIEMLAQFTNQTVEQIREDARPEAVQSLRIKAAVDEIIRIEQIEATREEISKAVADICAANNITLDQLKEVYDASFEQIVKTDITMRKAMTLVRESADITMTDDGQ